MNSGQYITYFLIFSVLVVFPAWELIQLYRRRNGNKSARTMSQYVILRAKEGSRFWKGFILGFPIFIILVMLWLIPHWEGLCINFGWFCDVDV